MTSPLPYVPPFQFTPRKFSLHNSSPDAFHLRWGGLVFTVPGVDQVGQRPAEYEDGSPIPGTVVLKDAGAPGRDGIIEARGWRAEDAIRNVLGIDPETGEASGVAARAGISFLPDRPSRQLVQAVRADGERRWHESQVEWAEHEVGAQMAAIEKAKEAGTLPPMPGKDYRRAVSILEKFHKKLDETFGKQDDAAIEDLTHDDEIEMEIYLKASAMKMAEKIAAEKEVDKGMLAEEMLQDPKIRKHLQKKYRIRKIGHQGMPDEPAPPQKVELSTLQEVEELEDQPKG